MKKRLNVWQRLGVVASVLWMIGGGLWQRARDVREAVAVTMSCSDAVPVISAQDCYRYADRVSDEMMRDSWWRVAWTAIVPVILVWLLVYVVIWTVRWVLMGRQQRAS